MSQTYDLNPQTIATGDRALTWAARFWFLVAAVGQVLFIHFILAFYGARTASGRLEGWNEKPLIDGHIPGDTLGNVSFAIHVLLAAAMTLTGLIQLVPQVRAWAPALHRFSGRAFLSLAAILAISGVGLVWIRGTYLNIVSAWAITLDAVLILVFGGLALRAALGRDFTTHRRWALRTFMVANGVWFLRVGMMAWVILNQGPVGMGRNMDGPFDRFWAFGNFLFPLLILELFLLAEASRSLGVKYAMAALLTVLTLIMGVGVFGTQAIMWAPYL